MSAARPKFDKARAVARDILTRFEVTTPPVPVEKIARSLGIEVQYSAFDGNLSGLAFVSDSILIICVNNLHHPHRQRFTLAHELAHIQLHSDRLTAEVHIDSGILGREGKSSASNHLVEREANEFAAELLMPQRLLDAELDGRQADLEDDAFVNALAKRFKVGEMAMRFRLRTLE